jgi:predicted amidohydrolase YtcJ
MDAARPQAEALAVRNDTIIAVGSDDEINPYMSLLKSILKEPWPPAN